MKHPEDEGEWAPRSPDTNSVGTTALHGQGSVNPYLTLRAKVPVYPKVAQLSDVFYPARGQALKPPQLKNCELISESQLWSCG